MNLRKIILWLCLIAVAALVIIPIIYIISSSFKIENEIFRDPFTIIPLAPTVQNFATIFDPSNNFILYSLNSIKVTVSIVLLQVLTSSTAAYAFAKLKWKWRDSLFLVYIASTMIPIQVIIIPQFLIIRNMGLYDTHAALLLVSAFTAFGAFLIKQFFMTIPSSLNEAAYIDGANDFFIFTRIILPLSKPVLATTVIFSFRYFWNDFFSPLIYLTSIEKKTLPLGLADFAGEFQVLYGPQMAGALISLLPVMIVFFMFQRFIVSSIASTGIK